MSNRFQRGDILLYGTDVGTFRELCSSEFSGFARIAAFTQAYPYELSGVRSSDGYERWVHLAICVGHDKSDSLVCIGFDRDLSGTTCLTEMVAPAIRGDDGETYTTHRRMLRSLRLHDPDQSSRLVGESEAQSRQGIDYSITGLCLFGLICAVRMLPTSLVRDDLLDICYGADSTLFAIDGLTCTAAVAQAVARAIGHPLVCEEPPPVPVDRFLETNEAEIRFLEAMMPGIDGSTSTDNELTRYLKAIVAGLEANTRTPGPGSARGGYDSPRRLSTIATELKDLRPGRDRTVDLLATYITVLEGQLVGLVDDVDEPLEGFRAVGGGVRDPLKGLDLASSYLGSPAMLRKSLVENLSIANLVEPG